MLDPRIDAVTADLVALEAVVRAMAHSQAKRSRTALLDMLAALEAEAERIRTCPTFSGVNRDEVCGVLEAWVEDLKTEAWQAEATAA